MFPLRKKEKISVEGFVTFPSFETGEGKEEIFYSKKKIWCNHDFAPFHRWRDNNLAMRIFACLKFLWYSQTLYAFCWRRRACLSYTTMIYESAPWYIIWYVWKYLYLPSCISGLIRKEKKSISYTHIYIYIHIANRLYY